MIVVLCFIVRNMGPGVRAAMATLEQMAIAYASVLIVLMLAAITGIQLLVGERRLRRRAAPLPVAKGV